MKKVVMIEAGANEVSDSTTMFAAIMHAHEEIKELMRLHKPASLHEIGKPKFSYPSGELDHDMFDKIFAFCEKDVMNALDTDDKNVRDARMVPRLSKGINSIRCLGQASAHRPHAWHL